jgi:hypothetical protein
MKNKKNATTSQTSEGYKSLFRPHNGQKKKDKRTNNDQQNIHIKLTHNIGKAEVQPFCPNREDALYPNRKQ